MSSNNPDFIKRVMEKVEKLVSLRNEVSKLADNLRFDAPLWIKGEDPCPLEEHHYDLSYELDGLHSYEWQCPFCGKTFG